MDYSCVKEGDNIATIYLPKMSIDNGTMEQIRLMLKHPTIKNPIYMPDCHRGGKGCCVGTTVPILKDIIAPRYVGGDIGCGISTYPIGKIDEQYSMDQIDNIVRKNIMMGSGADSVFTSPVVKNNDLDEIYKWSLYEANEFAIAFKLKFNEDIFKHRPHYDSAWFTELCKKIDIDEDYALCSIGTLGGGNHYVEINKNKSGDCYLTIHSGSRALGDKICAYHQDKIDKTRRFDYDEYKYIMKQANRKFKASKTLKDIADRYKDDFDKQKHVDYLEADEAYEYYFDMIFAQKYAQYNRRTMIKQVLAQINIVYNEDNIIESIHNYIDFKDFIMRKGAISAHKDQLCIVSLNMRDGILLCKGKGNDEWYCSSAHGTGRLLTRDKAKSTISLTKFKESMNGIYSSSICEETIDESPFSYKNTEEIIKYLTPTVEIVEQLRPIYNAKALS